MLDSIAFFKLCWCCCHISNTFPHQHHVCTHIYFTTKGSCNTQHSDNKVYFDYNKNILVIKKCYLWNKDAIKMQILCCLYIRCDNNNESGVLIGYALETPGVDLKKKRCYMSRCKVSAKLGCVITIYTVWLQWGWQSGIVTQLDVMDARTGLLLSIIIWAGEEFH